MTGIKAIETTYAGCRFRSRLEARWAVFFDHVGLKWRYEPEGLEFDGVRYLPDFQVFGLSSVDLGSDEPMFVEVKGLMDTEGARKVVGLAQRGHPVLVVGDIPRPGVGGPHFVYFRENLAYVKRVGANPNGVSAHLVAIGPHCELYPCGWPEAPVWEDTGMCRPVDLVNSVGDHTGWITPFPLIDEAFQAARSARFEHGDSGARHTGGAPAKRRRPAAVFAPPEFDPHLHVQREALKAALQVPTVAGLLVTELPDQAFTHPALQAVRRGVHGAYVVAGLSGQAWVDAVAANCTAEVRPLVSELAAEPLEIPRRLRKSESGEARYVAGVVACVRLALVEVQIAELQGRLQCTDPVEEPDVYSQLFGDLLPLEQYKIALRELADGAVG